MSHPFFVPIVVLDDTQPGSARREANRLAALTGMPENDVGRVAVVVTEAAKNVVKHGRGGEVLLRGETVRGTCTIDVLALDKGKGMDNIEDCMRDGYSTAGTPGTGMGAMQRMSDELEVYSGAGLGTAVHCRISSGEKQEQAARALECAAVVVPLIGETRCGDSWAEHHTDTHSVFMVVDGLGHGAGAAEAADEAVSAFDRIHSNNPLDILDEAHHSMRKTRGAAVSVAAIDHTTRKVRFAGVGNVAAAIMHNGKSQHLVSYNGIIGHSVARMQEFTYDWPTGATLVMCSDGISTHWNLGRYPGLQSRSALLAAAVLYRDYGRRRDDATVLIARERTPRS